LNDGFRAGEAEPLEVRIAQKVYVAASGASLEVLREIAFSLRRGEVAAFVGPSGCGKTTMLRIIARIDRDYIGKVDLPQGTKLGMVFQEPRLLNWRTVEDNVRLVAPRASDATIANLFRTLDLSQHRAHYPGELSLGLARRVALARAFAIDPDLLLLDEPFVSLDAHLADRLREELARLIDQRRLTTILVTHDVAEAIQLADRIFLLSTRPAKIIAEIPVDIPRAARSREDIAVIGDEIAGRLFLTPP
jgi:ABC-type nitrate/sulfonate/bicarbonate transport system ATPase subunit